MLYLQNSAVQGLLSLKSLCPNFFFVLLSYFSLCRCTLGALVPNKTSDGPFQLTSSSHDPTCEWLLEQQKQQENPLTPTQQPITTSIRKKRTCLEEDDSTPMLTGWTCYGNRTGSKRYYKCKREKQMYVYLLACSSLHKV